MDHDKKRVQWRRVLTVAYDKPLSKRWRRDEVPTFPGWFFDALVIATCVLLASGYYFGWAGVIVTLILSPTLLYMTDHTKRSAKQAEDSTKDSAAKADDGATTAPATKDSSGRGPAWDDHSNRVKVAIWKHTQKNGELRFTTSICRSYKDDDKKWVNTHFFDRDDLKDVIKVANQALDQIDRLNGIAA